MRQELSVNEATSGLEVLDDIAEAILDETGKAGDAFSGPILLLPKPTRMRESKGAHDHQRFTSYLPESPKSTPSGPKNPPKTPPKAKPKSPSKVSKKRKSPSPALAVNFFMDALAKEEAWISKALRDNKYELPTVASFDPKEAKASGFTPIVSDHGSYTAIWKSGTAGDDEEEEEEDGSGSEEDDSDEDKPPPPKKPKPLRSSSDSSGEGTTTL
ncbi:hypothetical protein PF004_g13861 [Phytophthora fragariae]|uniref:Uncharacterized protein n=1 Tax=Phytophthora fragariae TaxID=53985 RepID=A0A6G0NR03_9STRA|nr:hypothetical protein PF004_g13861 [Phytophthora fragariae]